MLILAILKLVDDEMILVDYLEQTVIRKLRRMAGLKEVVTKRRKKSRVKKDVLYIDDDVTESEYSDDEGDDFGKIKTGRVEDSDMKDAE